MSKSFWIVLAVIALLAWSPWVTKASAEKTINQKHEAKWAGVRDGCGPITEFSQTRWIPFGFISSVTYQCGLRVSDDPGHWYTIYVSPLMTIHGDY